VVERSDFQHTPPPPLLHGLGGTVSSLTMLVVISPLKPAQVGRTSERHLICTWLCHRKHTWKCPKDYNQNRVNVLPQTSLFNETNTWLFQKSKFIQSDLTETRTVVLGAALPVSYSTNI